MTAWGWKQSTWIGAEWGIRDGGAGDGVSFLGKQLLKE